MDEKSWKVLIRLFETLFIVDALLVGLFYILYALQVDDFGRGPDFGAGAVLVGGYLLGGGGLVGLVFVLFMRWRDHAQGSRQ